METRVLPLGFSIQRLWSNVAVSSSVVATKSNVPKTPVWGNGAFLVTSERDEK